MRVMVIVKATKESDEQSLPIDMKADAEAFEAMGKFNDELTRAGVMVIASGLKPSRFGKRVRFDGTKRSVTDGPFAETKELVAGFSLWEVQSMDEALEWVKRSPSSTKGPIEIEIRPLLELEDFGTDVPAEEVAQWEKMTGRA